MSRDIEERVVAMKLQNSEFEKNAKTTLGTLGKIAESLKFTGASKGLQGIETVAKQTKLGGLSGAVEGVTKKFSALSVIGVTALATIANRAVSAGIDLVRSLTIGPIGNGFSDYNEKLTSVQTIMNATGKSMEVVGEYFKVLDTYADQTIYNLSDMTSAMAKFVNAGIDLSKAVPAIKGIANMVALAGQGAGAATIAMYNLSQSIATGYLTTTDYRSLNLANVATKQWKDYMIQAAVAAGTLKKVGKDAYHIVGEKAGTASTAAALFSEKLADGWANSKVLLKVLGDYGNPLTAIGRKALAAAQDVKSLPMMLETLRAGVGTGWTDTFEIVLGNLKESKALFTGLTNYIGAYLGKMQDARNKTLTEWKKAGGRNALIDGLKNSFQALFAILKPIGDAFRQVFPSKTGKELASMTKTFRDFTAGLKIGAENADRLKRTFAGVFSIFKVGYTLIKFVATVLFKLFGIAQDGSGSILALTAAAGDFLVSIEKWLTTNNKIKQFFSTIDTARATIIVPLVAIIGDLAEGIAALLSGDLDGFKAKMMEAFQGLGPLLDGLWKSLTSQIRGTLANLRDMTGIASEFLKSLGVAALAPVQKMLATLSENFGKLRTIIQDFGFEAFTAGSKGAAGGMSFLSATVEKLKAIWETIKDLFSGLGDFLAPILGPIGDALGTIGQRFLDFIANLDALDVMTGVSAVGMFQMFTVIRDMMRTFQGGAENFKGVIKNLKGIQDTIKGGFTDALKVLQTNVKANLILKIAISVGILALSLKLLSTIDPAKLAAGVTAIGVLMFALTRTMGSMLGMLEEVEGQAPKKVGSILAAGGALLMLSGAILLLSFAVKNIADLSWAEMAQGLIGVGALLAGLALFTKFAEMEEASLKAGANLILLAGAIYLISFSVSKLGSMDQGQLIQGAIAVQSILATLGLVSQAMGDAKSMKGAVAIIAMAGALAVLTPVIITLGFVPFENLARGLGTLAIALVGLATVAHLMGDQKSIKGAAGIALMAGALAILTPALIALGLIPVDTLIQGLAGIAIALVLFAGASQAMGDPKTLMGAASVVAMAFALQMLAPVILILGQADLSTLALGLGAIAVAFGILIAAGALAGMVAPGLAALALTLLAIGAAMVLAGVGMAAFAAGFTALVALGTAGFAVLTVGFASLLNLIPAFAQKVGEGIIAIAGVITTSGPQIIAALTVVLISFLRAIDNAAPKFFDTMARLIMGLVNTVTRLIPQIAAAGARMILRFLNVLSNYVPQIVNVAVNMLVRFINAISNAIPRIATAAVNLMIRFINTISAQVPRLVEAGFQAIIRFINSLTATIDANAGELGAAGGRLAAAIVRGMVNGITAGVGEVGRAARGLASRALSAVGGFLGIHSPSREFAKLGAFSAKGFVVGLDGGKAEITKSVSDLQVMIKAAQKNAAEDVKALEKKLSHMKKYHRRDKAGIAATTKALAAARSELARANKAWAVSRSHGDELRMLQKLADKQTALTAKIVEGNKALEDAKKARDDYAKSTADQYDNLISVSEETKLSDYVKDMQKQIVDTQLFTAQLAQLRAMGLNEEMYRELLGKGAAAMPFAQQILEGGQTSVDELNSLGSSLSKAATGIGNQASKDLYQAGVDAAAGLVQGLKNQQAAIEVQMDKIAAGMVASIKKALGIRSPSRVFRTVGDWSAKGLAEGLKRSSDLPNKAAAEIGHGTIDALRKSLTGLEKAVASEVDIDPTIRPVLDLSAIKRDAVKMGAMLDGGKVSVDAILARARSTEADHSANRAFRDDMALVGAGDTTIFNQTNTSPKALSDVEIYRQTKNVISTAKGARIS